MRVVRVFAMCWVCFVVYVCFVCVYAECFVFFASATACFARYDTEHTLPAPGSTHAPLLCMWILPTPKVRGCRWSLRGRRRLLDDAVPERRHVYGHRREHGLMRLPTRIRRRVLRSRLRRLRFQPLRVLGPWGCRVRGHRVVRIQLHVPQRLDRPAVPARTAV